jgi:hypothetical protein
MRQSWRIVDVPRIRLDNLGDDIDIGFLEGDDHRRAFTALFCRAFTDNRDLLDGVDLVEIRTSRFGDLATIGLPLRLDPPGLDLLAQRLYDSGNELVQLVLRRYTRLVVLNVRCDNPAFWLTPHAV